MMIELKNIDHYFDKLKAVDDVSLTLSKGQVMGLIGENGAGKTTLMRIITGFLKPAKGGVVVKGQIGYMPEGAPLYQDMTAQAFLKFIAMAKKVRNSKKEIDRVTALTGIKTVIDKDIAWLSKGFKRRVSLAAALIADPEVLILDEPSEGLDPNQKDELKKTLAAMDKAIVLSTHVLEDVKALCSDVAIIHRGRIVFTGKNADIPDLEKQFKQSTKG